MLMAKSSSGLRRAGAGRRTAALPAPQRRGSSLVVRAAAEKLPRWDIVWSALLDKGLKSLSPEEVQKRVKDGWVILDGGCPRTALPGPLCHAVRAAAAAHAQCRQRCNSNEEPAAWHRATCAPAAPGFTASAFV